MANVVHVHLHMYHGAGKVDIDAEIETLLLLAGLPAGKPGRKILKKRAPDALFSEEAGREFPIVVEFLNRSITAVYVSFSPLLFHLSCPFYISTPSFRSYSALTSSPYLVAVSWPDTVSSSTTRTTSKTTKTERRTTG